MSRYVYPRLVSKIHDECKGEKPKYITNYASQESIEKMLKDKDGIANVVRLIGHSYQGFGGGSPTLLSDTQITALREMCKAATEEKKVVIKLGAGEGKTFLSKLAAKIFPDVFNQPIIPLDGNVERVLKRILNLKTEKQLNKKSLDEKKKVFGSSNRSNDYAEALMELGALICRPKNPYCEKCPITKDCMSYKNKDFKIKKRKKIIINKFYAVTLYINKGQILLIKNDKFKFLKNLLIFPMKETSESNFLLKNNKLNLKMSNLNMNISIDLIKTKKKNKEDLWIAKENLKNYMLPNFTKKIFSSIEGFL